jgi:hypothetical protein
MSGFRIRAALECLLYFLRSLPSNCFSNIFRFGTSFKSLFTTSVPYNNESLHEATKMAKALSADLGGTNLLPVFANIFSGESDYFRELL